MNSTVTSRGNLRQHAEELGTLAGRNTGCGLVEQQQRGLRRQRERDLQQPLLAVREIACELVTLARQMQRLQQRVGFVGSLALLHDGPMPHAGVPLALAHGEHDRLQHGQPGKQRVDLERPRHPALDALVLRQRRDVVVAEKDFARRGRKHARQQVDERRLARAVRADQRVSRTGRKRKRYLAVRVECAPALGEPPRAQCGLLRRGGRIAQGLRPRRRARSASSPPRMPPWANSTMTMRKKPIQNCQ